MSFAALGRVPPDCAQRPRRSRRPRGKEFVDVRFSGSRKTKSDPHEVCRLIEVLLRAQRTRPGISVGANAHLVEHPHEVSRRRSQRPFELPEVPPRRRHRRERMFVGQFQYDAASRVLIQSTEERNDVTDVVDDVMRRHDVGARRILGHFRPTTFDRGARDAAQLRVPRELGEHRRLCIHANHARGWWRQCERGNAGAATHVEHAVAGVKDLSRALVRG